jgi:integrase
MKLLIEIAKAVLSSVKEAPPDAVMLFDALDEYEEKVTVGRSRGSYFGDTPPARVGGTRALEQTIFDRFRATLGNVPLGAITEEHCELYRRRLRARWGAKAQTVARHEQPLRNFFKWCIEQGYLEISPMAEMKNLPPEEKRETDQLSVDEVTALLKAGAPWLSRAMYFMGMTAARRTQTCFVRFRDYDRERRVLLFRPYKGFRTKNGKSQTFPLTDELIAFLDRVHAQAKRKGRGPDDLIITGPRGEPVRPDRLSKAIRRLMDEVLKRDVGAACHAFRRTAASRWAEAGASPTANASLLGHSPKSGSRVVEESYIRSSPEYLQRIVTRAPTIPPPPR